MPHPAAGGAGGRKGGREDIRSRVNRVPNKHEPSRNRINSTGWSCHSAAGAILYYGSTWLKLVGNTVHLWTSIFTDELRPREGFVLAEILVQNATADGNPT